MAKKRRRPHPRSHAGSTSPGAVRTQERPAGGGAAPGNGTDTGGSGAPSRTRQASQRSRAEKKELARRQREEVRRRIRRAEMRRRFLWATGGAAVLAVAVFLIFRPDEPSTRPDELPGELRTESPWPANSELALERADAIGLPAEGTTLHEHANVQVFVHGESVAVPQNVGINDEGLASLHTHTGDGLVHIESSQRRTFTLGEFFDVWGVRLTDTCMGAYCAEGNDELIVFRDSERVSGSIRDVTRGWWSMALRRRRRAPCFVQSASATRTSASRRWALHRPGATSHPATFTSMA